MEPIIFACSRDRFTSIFTLVILIIIISVSVSSYIALAKSGAIIPASIILFANVSLIVSVFVFVPLSYVVSRDKVIVKRIGPNVEIAVSDIERVDRDNGEMLKGSIRLGANGGLGGYVGLFSNKTLGRYRAYMTRKDNVVLIETDSTKYVLSPDDPDRFIAVLHGMVVSE